MRTVTILLAAALAAVRVEPQIFSIAFRDRDHRIVVGGNYQKERDAIGVAPHGAAAYASGAGGRIARLVWER